VFASVTVSEKFTGNVVATECGRLLSASVGKSVSEVYDGGLVGDAAVDAARCRVIDSG
jgi:hypothetical protein